MFKFEDVGHEGNRKNLKKHIRHAELQGLSDRRKRDIFVRMKKILNGYSKNRDFFELSKEDYEDISIELQKTMKSYYSISSYIKTIRRFVRVILELESSESLPRKFRGLRCPRDKGKYKMFKGVDDIITPSQAFEMVNNAKNKRDAFIFMVLVDTGLRPHELLKLKRRDIIKNELNYWYVQVPKDTKTGFRRVRLIFSIPYVEDYLNHIKDDPNIDLIGFSSERLVKIIREMGNITPYILRHSSASFYARYLNEAELCERYGWIAGSKQVRTYVHLSQKQVDDKLNKVLNINNCDESDNLEKLQPKFCLNCASYSNHDSKICSVCKQTLDIAEKIRKDKMDGVAYKSATELYKVDPKRFIEIASSFGVSFDSML